MRKRNDPEKRKYTEGYRGGEGGYVPETAAEEEFDLESIISSVNGRSLPAAAPPPDAHDGEAETDAPYDGGDEDYPDEDYEDGDYPPEPTPRKPRSDRHRKLKISLIIVLSIFLIIGIGLSVAGYFVTHSGVSLPNLYVDGVYVGEMSAEQISAALEKGGWVEASDVPLTVELMNTVSFEVDKCDSGAMLTLEQATAAAEGFGHGHNWYLNLYEYVRCFLRPVDIHDTSIVLDRDYVLARVDEGIEALEKELGDGSYEVDEEKSVLRMIKGAGQLEFDREAMADAIFAAMAADKTELSYTTVLAEPKAPDFDAIFEELSAEPKDAAFTEDNTFTVIDHVVGCDFDTEEARELWNEAENAATVEVPLEITLPEVTSEYLNGLLYRDLLGASTTYYKNSVDNRISNLNKAADKLNGVILYPGDVFSYNGLLGQRTEEAGFLPAGAYENGEVVEEVGGGICQVSSTLYAAMLYGYKLTTVERYPHYFPVDYLEKGYDATVSWPDPDFKFRNDRDFPVKIVAKCDNEERALTVEIWGTNLDGCYIELRKDTLAYNNSKYPWIHEGWGVQVFRYVFDSNGMQVDQVNEIYDIYHTHEATEQIKALDAQAAAAEAAAAAGMAGFPPMQ